MTATQLTAVDTAAATARRRTIVTDVARRAATGVAAVGLAAMLALGGAASGRAAGDDAFSTAATGLVRLGTADPRWLAAPIELDEGDELDDPGDGGAGFLIAQDGATLVVDDDGRETLLEPGDARFVAQGDELTLRAIDGDAELWRVVVTTSSAGNPLEGDGVGETLVAHSGSDDGADQDARRKVSLRIGTLEDGDDATAGGDDETVPFLIAMDGDLIVGDDEEQLDEGDALALERSGEVDLEADGDALVVFVAVSPALDPDDLTAGGGNGGGSGGGSSSRATRTPTTVVDTGGNTGGNTGGTADPDPDGDGLTNSQEDALGTDPNDSDSDDGGVSDGVENGKGTDPLDDDDDNVGPAGGGTDSDPDGDGLRNDEEQELGTDGRDPDTDDGGVDDGDEVADGTNPLNPNDDGQGGGGVEPVDPAGDSDEDGDGLTLDDETRLGTDPTKVDTDDDMLWDSYETNNSQTDPLDPDSDDDELGDAQEDANRTDPHDQDTDDDMLWDGYEINNSGTDPLDPDSDDDLLGDAQEDAAGTDPHVADTDGDGFTDAEEVAFGTNPNDPNSKPTFELPDIDIPGF